MVFPRDARQCRQLLLPADDIFWLTQRLTEHEFLPLLSPPCLYREVNSLTSQYLHLPPTPKLAEPQFLFPQEYEQSYFDRKSSETYSDPKV